MVSVDTNMRGEETTIVRFYYGGVSYDTASFTVKVLCPVLTHTPTITPATYAYFAPVPFSATKQAVFTNNFVNIFSTSSYCLLNYYIVDTGTNAGLGGTWLSTTAAGNVELDTNVLGT
jgi:hypothetical protein